MKDVISILQSRVAKRSALMNKEIVCIYYEDGSFDVKTMAQEPHHFDSIPHTTQQKTDKRILAEIVRLRREVKQQRRAKALRAVLHKGIKRCQEMSEQEVLEMENKILAARWGE